MSTRRDSPEKQWPEVDDDFPVRLPVAHAELMRHDAGPRAQFLQELGPETFVDRGQEIQRDDCRRRNVGLEDVTFDEADPIGDAGFLGVARRLGDELRVEIDPDAAARRFGARGIGIRPSPDPRSYTTSFLSTSARRSMASTTSSGVGTKWMSGVRLGCWPAASRAADKRTTAMARIRAPIRA